MHLVVNPFFVDEKKTKSGLFANVLTKCYFSIAELEKNNDVEPVFYDPTYDDTPYLLYEHAVEHQKKYRSTSVREFIAAQLLKSEYCAKHLIMEMVDSVVNGK
jgi:hypothetical protein